MLRVLLQYLLPLLLPFLVYAAYVALAKRRAPGWLDLDEQHWLVLGGTGLVLLAISLVTWTAADGRAAGRDLRAAAPGGRPDRARAHGRAAEPMAARRDRPLAGAAWLRAPASRRVLAALAADGRAGALRRRLRARRAARPAGVGRDLDLATPERPEQVMRLLERAGLQAIPTGLAHGTVTTIADGRRFEITTLRRDVACDGRHAEVAFTDDFAADAARRDFTINAMSCDADGPAATTISAAAPTSPPAGCASSATPRRASPRTICASCASSASSPATAGRRPTPRRSPPARAAAPDSPPFGRAHPGRDAAGCSRRRSPLPALRLMAETGVLGEVIPGPVALERLARLLELAPDSDPLLRLAALLRPPPARSRSRRGGRRALAPGQPRCRAGCSP